MLTAQGGWDEVRLFFEQVRTTGRWFFFDELAFEAVNRIKQFTQAASMFLILIVGRIRSDVASVLKVTLHTH